VVIPRQGELWWAEARDKRRPVLVVTRSGAIHTLTTIVVAPVTRKVRGIPTEIALDARDGLREPCAASFDNLQPVRRAALTARVGEALPGRHAAICSALSALTDCPTGLAGRPPLHGRPLR
jgi:mRNA interferase MazF